MKISPLSPLSKTALSIRYRTLLKHGIPPFRDAVLGSLWTASVLHPEQYSAEAFQEDVTEFYETFYDFTPDLSALEQ